MLKDCIDVFKNKLDEIDTFVIDENVPKDGTYILISLENDKFIEKSKTEISTNKRKEVQCDNKSIYPYLSRLDYNSKLLDMNKPIDSTKTIHSNNYYTFFIKKEKIISEKLLNESVNSYYDILTNPRIKYDKKKEAKKLYDKVEQEIGIPDKDRIEKIKLWVIEYIKDIIKNKSVDFTKKDYLKIFFVYDDEEKTIKEYEKEGNRYNIPNIFNTNDYNISTEDTILGIPNNNIGMNAKKPFLEHKSRGNKAPFMLNQNDVLIQNQFFDYLEAIVSKGIYDIYFDYDNNKILPIKSLQEVSDINSGAYLRLAKEKNEASINEFEIISGYCTKLKNKFTYNDILAVNADRDADKDYLKYYGKKCSLYEIEIILDHVFFNKSLKFNYFNEPNKISMQDSTLKQILLIYRKFLHEWLYSGNTNLIQKKIDKMSREILRNSISGKYTSKARHQLNLRWSLLDYFNKDGGYEEMINKAKESLRNHIDSKEEWEFSTDDEYFYAVGQLCKIYYNLNKSNTKSPALYNAIFVAKKDELIKDNLKKLQKKYNYALNEKNIKTTYKINGDKGNLALFMVSRINKLIGHVHGYKLQSEKQINMDLLIAGFYDDSILYMKKKEDK